MQHSPITPSTKHKKQTSRIQQTIGKFFHIAANLLLLMAIITITAANTLDGWYYHLSGIPREEEHHLL